MAKTGLILEGGAFRGVFTSGVLDVLLENKIEYSYIVGASAGAGNGMAYVSKQPGRTRKVIKPYNHKDNYFGMKQVFKHGKFLNLDIMFYEYPFKQYPFDFDTMYASDKTLEIVVSNCETGEAEYFSDYRDTDKFLAFGKASCSLPILCKPVSVGNMHYLDGSICDSIPLERAISQGCDRFVVVMTKSIDEAPTDYGKLKGILAMYYKKKYPNFYQALLDRTTVYRKEFELLQRLEEEGRAIVIRPDMKCIKKFEQKDAKVDEFYMNGRKLAEANLDRLRAFLDENAGGQG